MNTSTMVAAECPVCFELFSDRIYLCKTGHSLCDACSAIISTCPICQQPINDQRNYAMESMLKTLSVTTSIDHNYDCPLEDKCTYTTTDVKTLICHLRNSHARAINVLTSDKFKIQYKKPPNHTDVTYHYKMVEIKKTIFKFCTKIKWNAKMVYFAMQIVGSIADSSNYVFEVDYIECVRSRKYFSEVTRMTNMKDAFETSCIAEIPLQLVTTAAKSKWIIYARLFQTPPCF